MDDEWITEAELELRAGIDEPEPVAVISISSEPCPEDETTRCIGQGWGPFADRLAAQRFADTLPLGFLLHFVRLQSPHVRAYDGSE